jgi:hypothetical protein
MVCGPAASNSSKNKIALVREEKMEGLLTTNDPLLVLA